MRIALVYNLRPVGLDRHDPRLEAVIEGDEWKTIEAIGNAFIANHHEVSYYPIDSDIYTRLKNDKSKIDLLFNNSEGVSPGPSREAHIPMLCEILGIPYTGPDPLSAGLILNKSRAKEIWRSHGIATAQSELFTDPQDNLDPKLHFPLIVKPNGEGSGMGIKNSSIVHNHQELKFALSDLFTTYSGGALVEEYLSGREFTIGLIGNGDKLLTLPIIEINFDAFPPGAPKIDTFAAKFVYGATGEAPMHETEFCPAKVTPQLAKELNQAAVAAYQTIGCRDFGRVDLRLNAKGVVHVMEINHPPGLMSDPEESSFFTIAGRVAGYTFSQLIGKILDSAITRLHH
jgi:D-alanine-D-alanine ligase